MSVRSITGGTTSIKYTQITDTLVDITGVTNSTYFYNKADSLSYFKDNGGNIFHTFTGSSTSNISTSGSISATTYLNLPIDVTVTGATYSNNTFTYTNNTGGTFNVLFNTLTGLTVNGSISATTISGGTFYGNGSNLTGIIPPLSQGQIFIGDNTNSAAARNVIGDININYTGNTTIQPNVVTYSKIQNVSQAAVLGSTSTTGGTVEEIVMIEAYINASGTTATLLSTTGNWDINGVYIGTTITGTTQGQSHYNSDYWFTAIDDNSWIRMIRG